VKAIFKLLIFLGAILFYGTAGASDYGSLEWSQAFLQVSIAFCMIGVGIVGQKVLKKNEKIKRPRQTNTESVLFQNAIQCNYKQSISQ
jgi:hypothetical protein